MSGLNVYATEPATRGKVVLHTSLGPLDVELWPKEAPKACRNFLQLCMEGYYDGLLFHRVIKDFMAQTGDPTGRGTGGESVYGRPFEDEFHGRLRFTHRGVVAMANNAPNSNGSQFFVTLGRCDWLDRRHTIFGKVTGNSLYNLNRFNDLELGDADRPLYPPTLEKTEVLFDPFDDIVPRPLPPREARWGQEAGGADAAQKKRKRAKRNTSLLSFGDEEDTPAIPGPTPRAKSIHDAGMDKDLGKGEGNRNVYGPDLGQPAAAAEGVEPSPSSREARLGTKFEAGAENIRIDRMGADRESEMGGGWAARGPEQEAGPVSGDDLVERLRRQAQERSVELMRLARSKKELSGTVRAEVESLKQELRADRLRGGTGAESEAARVGPGSGWRWGGKGAADSDDDHHPDEGDGEAPPSGGNKGGAISAAGLEARRALYVSKAKQLRGLGKKDRARDTLLKMKMFEQSQQLQLPGLHKHRLAPKQEKRMAAGTDDMYEVSDPLADGSQGDIAESRAMQKILERKRMQSQRDVDSKRQ